MARTRCTDPMRKLQRAQCTLLKALEQLQSKVTGLPANENTQRISETPVIFTMRSRHLLGVSWDVNYHDFTAQYEAVRQMIAEHPLDVTARWSRIRSAGQIEQGGKKLPLHPTVIKNIDQLLGVGN